MAKPGFVTVGGKKLRAFFDDKNKPIEVYDKEINSYRDYRSYMEKESRVVCGKARSCKLSGGKIVDVYDEDKKVYVPYEEFLRQQEEYKTNPIYDDTADIEKKKEEKKEYYTTHGKKTKEIKLDKKLDIQTLPTNTLSTAINTSGTSGTIPAIDYTMSVPVNVDDSKVDSDRVKIINKKKEDPIDWYIRRILKY